MFQNSILERLNNKIIVSCQPIDGPMNNETVIACSAKSAIIGGAGGVRIEGASNIKATRKILEKDDLIIGIIKHNLENYEVKISPFIDDVLKIIESGANIVAIDGTNRSRPHSIKELLNVIKKNNILSMADCSNIHEATFCYNLGFDIISSTLSGYTTENTPKLPDIELVKQIQKLGCFVMAEGRYHNVELVKQVKEYANAVTIGTALTRLEIMTSWFVDAFNE